MAVKAGAIGQLNEVINASAKAIGGYIGKGRRCAACALQFRITASVQWVNRIEDRTTIDGKAIDALRRVHCLCQINKVQRVVKARIDIIGLQIPPAEKAGFCANRACKTNIGANHCGNIQVWIG